MMTDINNINMPPCNPHKPHHNHCDCGGHGHCNVPPSKPSKPQPPHHEHCHRHHFGHHHCFSFYDAPAIYSDYRRYDLDSGESRLISRDEQIHHYIEHKFGKLHIDPHVIENTIDKSMNKFDNKLCGIDRHIEDVKHEVIEAIENKPEDKMCVCNLATKEDVRRAVEDINSFTSSKFNEIDFNQKFTDLNEQVAEIIGELTPSLKEGVFSQNLYKLN